MQDQASLVAVLDSTWFAEISLTVDHAGIEWTGRVECGIGLCGHCQMGTSFVCRDGPVFSVAQLGDTFGREGI